MQVQVCDLNKQREKTDAFKYKSQWQGMEYNNMQYENQSKYNKF